ncbi:type I-B CRISPR-associated endonuclease Cas1b [Paludifilum halophilum]|uniref:CRISPR-associated endonuclease Cas1 n=1 Tax=Paludifilum halophilum TaxID=1642702 RepID=A0A235B1X8_9BACL|nr:type I-B CRISPR-associated endonuclease Cas1b [Paludifilum halophilum]OYD06231.1 subtype I-B CRISPR-associated endonuclease Cas1 [Paludifilum halophilum]
MKKSIYVFTNGEMRRKDQTLYFEGEEGRKYIPVEDTKEIHIFGEVNVSKKFLEFCSQKEIILHYYNYHGYYSGSFYPREHLNSGYMTVEQVRHYLDEDKRYRLARLFVDGAGDNMLKVLRYYQNRGKEVGAVADRVESALKDAEKTQDRPMLMAAEGHMREAYYSAFDPILQNKNFRFEKRSKRPPLNRLNALISFGNSILYTILLSEIYKTHLDPRIGFLHTSNFRRFSLQLDVAEIFKPIIVDRLILKMVGKQMLTKKDFDQKLNGILLSENGRKKFVAEMDERMKATVKHRTLNRKVSYRRLLRMELYKLQKHIMGEETYKPFVSPW